jgi:hypothetical protein
MTKTLVRAWAALACLSTLMAASVSVAFSAEAIAIQLNSAAYVSGACRLTFVIRNQLPSTIRTLSLDLVMFDKSEGVSGYAAVDFGELPSGKTRVRQYDVLKGDCGGISRVLLNDIRACEIEGETGKDCLPLLSISSRSEIELIL